MQPLVSGVRQGLGLEREEGVWFEFGDLGCCALTVFGKWYSGLSSILFGGNTQHGEKISTLPFGLQSYMIFRQNHLVLLMIIGGAL